MTLAVLSKVGLPVRHWSWNHILSLSLQKSQVPKTSSCSEADPQMATVIALQSKPGAAISLHRLCCTLRRLEGFCFSGSKKKTPVLYPEQVSPYQDDIHKSRTFVPTVPVLQYWKLSRMRDKYILSWFQEPVFSPCSILKLKIFADSQYTLCPWGSGSLTWPSPSWSQQWLPQSRGNKRH